MRYGQCEERRRMGRKAGFRDKSGEDAADMEERGRDRPLAFVVCDTNAGGRNVDAHQ